MTDLKKNAEELAYKWWHSVDKEFVDVIDAYVQGYKDAIDKACEWLEKNACNYEYSGGTCDSWFSASDLVESFRKYMEEQQ